MLTRIGKDRRPGVRDDRHGFALRNPHQDILRFDGLIMLVEGDQVVLNPQLVQELAAQTQLFTNDGIRTFQDIQSAQGNILGCPMGVATI